MSEWPISLSLKLLICCDWIGFRVSRDKKNRSRDRWMPHEKKKKGKKWNSYTIHQQLSLFCIRCHLFSFGFILLTIFPLLLHSPWKHLAPILPLLPEPIAVTLSSLGPGPLGTSPDCCLPGTYFLCPIPPSFHPTVPPPKGTGATLRTLTTRFGFVHAGTADGMELLIFRRVKTMSSDLIML